MLNAIIFDVDGTILDTEKAILQSLQRTLREETQKDYPFEALRFTLGIPGKDALQRLNVDDVEAVHQKWSAAVLDFHMKWLFSKVQRKLFSTLQQSRYN